MTTVDKIAVFDLDGTLWKVNSHVEVLNAYYNTSFFSSLLYRGMAHFFRKLMLRFLWHCYRKIPKNFSLTFEIPFDEDSMQLLTKKLDEGYFCLIVSNAPYEIIAHAAERLHLPFLQAPQYQKKKILDENYMYSKLFVCTDNIEDLDLVKAADSRKIIFTKYNKKKFNSEGIYD